MRAAGGGRMANQQRRHGPARELTGDGGSRGCRSGHALLCAARALVCCAVRGVLLCAVRGVLLCAVLCEVCFLCGLLRGHEVLGRGSPVHSARGLLQDHDGGLLVVHAAAAAVERLGARAFGDGMPGAGRVAVGWLRDMWRGICIRVHVCF